MLRKTDAAKVARIYDRFIRKYPTVEDLTHAGEASLRREIKPLGIVDRARILRLLAQRLAEREGGRVPSDFKALVRLPGVGPYTANALLCFVHRRDVPLLDTNVLRVLGRAFSVRSEKRRARDDPDLWRFAAKLVPKRRAVSYNHALLDFAALTCTVRNPKCSECPLNGICDFYAARAA